MRYKIEFYLRLFLVGIWFLISCLIGFLLLIFRWKDINNNANFARLCGLPSLRILGLRILIENEERLYHNQPCIYVANHQSNFDILTYGSMYPYKTVVIGKRELMRIPVFGLFFKGAGNIIIDRKDRVDSLAGMQVARDAIIQNRYSVWIFPEGTRNRGAEKLLPFKKGAFHLAISTQVPIIPIAHQHLRTYFDKKAKRMTRGTVKIRVLEAMPTAGLNLSDIPQLMDKVRHVLEASIHEISNAG